MTVLYHIFKLSFLIGAISATFNAFAEGQSNTWFAGTDYEGTIIINNLMWVCSGGTCFLTGEYGKGLNMEVCKQLSEKVGGLSYYYNDTGMVWAKTKNSALLDQCNSTQ